MTGLATHHAEAPSQFDPTVHSQIHSLVCSPANSQVNALARSPRPASWPITVLSPKPRSLGQRAPSSISHAIRSPRSPLPAPSAPAQSLGISLLSDSSALRGFVPRCSEKGCVFPQSRPGCAKCRQHERQSSEPDLFASRQPSVLLLDRAKFGVPDSDVDDQGSRATDRRNIAKLWQSFQEGV